LTRGKYYLVPPYENISSPFLPPNSVRNFCQAPKLKQTECKISSHKTTEDTEEENAYGLYNERMVSFNGT
jgi:hypothetical protein